MEQVDILIDGLWMLSSYDHTTTISDLVSSVMSEWEKHNCVALKFPKFAKDKKGRIIPGYFKVSDIKDREQFEIVLEEIATEKAANVVDIKQSYRNFQIGITKRLLEYLTTLHFKGAQQEPSEQSLSLIAELLLTPDEGVQLSCLELIQFLFTKFSSKKVLSFAHQQAHTLFNAAASSTIATSTLDLLVFVASDLVAVVDSAGLPALDVDSVLIRYPESETDIMRRINEIAANKDIKYTLQLPPPPNAASSSSLATAPSLVTNEPQLNHVVSTNSLDSVSGNKSHISQQQQQQQSLRQKQQMLLSRQLSLVSSADLQVRRFGLQKLLSRLLAMRVRFMGQHRVISTLDSGFEMLQDDLLSEDGDSRMGGGGGGAGGGVGGGAGAEVLPIISSKEDMMAIADSLFKCLKQCLDSRAGANRAKKDLLSEQQRRLQQQHIHDSNTATASVLIEAALSSEATDLQSILLIMQCCHTIRGIDVDGVLSILRRVFSSDLDSFYPDNGTSTGTGTGAGACTGSGVSNVLAEYQDHLEELVRATWSDASPPRLFLYTHELLECARDSLRLLVTLSHAHDSRIAEVCADLSNQVLQHLGCLSTAERGSAQVTAAKKDLMWSRNAVVIGWTSSGIHMEASALDYFLRPLQTTHQHRCQLALSYLLFLSRTKPDGVSTSGGSGGSGGGGGGGGGSGGVSTRGRSRKSGGGGGSGGYGSPGVDDRMGATGAVAGGGGAAVKPIITLDQVLDGEGGKVLSRLMDIAVAGVAVSPPVSDYFSSIKPPQDQAALLARVNGSRGMPRLSTSAKLAAVGTVSLYTRVCALECLAAAVLFSSSRTVLLEQDIVSQLLTLLRAVSNESQTARGLPSIRLAVLNSFMLQLIFGENTRHHSDSDNNGNGDGDRDGDGYASDIARRSQNHNRHHNYHTGLGIGVGGGGRPLSFAPETLIEGEEEEEGFGDEQHYASIQSTAERLEFSNDVLEAVRLIVKALANLLTASPNAAANREHIMKALGQVRVSCFLPLRNQRQREGGGEYNRWAIQDLAARDEILMFYYSLIDLD